MSDFLTVCWELKWQLLFLGTFTWAVVTIVRDLEKGRPIRPLIEMLSRTVVLCAVILVGSVPLAKYAGDQPWWVQLGAGVAIGAFAVVVSTKAVGRVSAAYDRGVSAAERGRRF